MRNDQRLLSANQCDRQYRLRKSTAATAARAKLVRSVERPGRGRYGKVILINVEDAERLWAAK